MRERYVNLNDVIATLEAEWGYEGMREDLENLPTADVVPRAEVDKLIYEKKILFDEGQVWHVAYKDALSMNAEVASVIFAEIEQEILRAIDNNLQRMAEQDDINEIWQMCVAKKNTLCGIYDFIVELKKKYTYKESTK